MVAFGRNSGCCKWLKSLSVSISGGFKALIISALFLFGMYFGNTILNEIIRSPLFEGSLQSGIPSASTTFW